MTYDVTNPKKPKIEKAPSAVLDYAIDLAAWLADVGDTLQSLTVVGDGVTVDSSMISGTKVVAWISGGTEGETASVTFRFTTAAGRTDDRTIYLKIERR